MLRGNADASEPIKFMVPFHAQSRKGAEYEHLDTALPPGPSDHFVPQLPWPSQHHERFGHELHCWRHGLLPCGGTAMNEFKAGRRLGETGPSRTRSGRSRFAIRRNSDEIAHRDKPGSPGAVGARTRRVCARGSALPVLPAAVTRAIAVAHSGATPGLELRVRALLCHVGLTIAGRASARVF